MPWKETGVVDERIRFIAALSEDPRCNFSRLCERFGISRSRGYKWVQRYEALGPAGLEDKKPIATTCPHRTPDPIHDLVVALRKEHPFDGPRKLRTQLIEAHPEHRHSGGEHERRHRQARGARASASRAVARAAELEPTRRSDFSEHDLVRRLQGALRRRRRHPVLSADDQRRVHALPREVRRDDRAARRPGARALRAGFRGIRIARENTDRQRSSVCEQSARWAVAAASVVDPTRHRARAHRAGAPRAERPTRADAPYAQGADRVAAKGDDGGEQQRCFSCVDFATDRRPHEARWAETTGALLRAVAPRAAGAATRSRVRRRRGDPSDLLGGDLLVEGVKLSTSVMGSADNRSASSKSTTTNGSSSTARCSSARCCRATARSGSSRWRDCRARWRTASPSSRIASVANASCVSEARTVSAKHPVCVSTRPDWVERQPGPCLNRGAICNPSSRSKV